MLHWSRKTDPGRRAVVAAEDSDQPSLFDGMAAGTVVAREGRVTYVNFPKDRLQHASFHVMQPHHQRLFQFLHTLSNQAEGRAARIQKSKDVHGP